MVYLCPAELFFTKLLHQNRSFDNLRDQGFEVNREKYADIMVHLSPPELFFPDLLHQNESFDMMRTREFEVNKKRGKSDPDGKERKCDKRISHISCQLPLIFSIFLLI